MRGGCAASSPVWEGGRSWEGDQKLKKKKSQKGSETGRDFWCDCLGPGSFVKVGGKTWEIPEPPSVRHRLRRKRGLYLVE